MGDSAAAKLMKKLDREANKPDTLEEHYYLALLSILRWTNRQGYPHEKIRAIREVAGTALLRDDGIGWSPEYRSIIGEEIPDLRGNPLNP